MNYELDPPIIQYRTKAAIQTEATQPLVWRRVPETSREYRGRESTLNSPQVRLSTQEYNLQSDTVQSGDHLD